MTGHLVYGYSSESTQQELSNDIQGYLCPYALDESSLSVVSVLRRKKLILKYFKRDVHVCLVLINISPSFFSFGLFKYVYVSAVFTVSF